MLTLPYVFISAPEVESERDQIQVYVNVDPPSEQVISVDFSITGMTANRVATPGEDYSLHGAPAGVYSGTITLAPEEIECEFFIDVVNDTAYEGREWLRISLSNPVNAQFFSEDELLHDLSNADTFIEDADDPYIVITPREEAVEPPTSTDVSYALFDVELLGGDELTPGQPTTVSWTTTVGLDDTATAGLDFQSSSGTVSPILDDEPATIQIPVIYDGSGESAETFQVTLTGATNGITILIADATVTIADAIAVPMEQPPPDGQIGTEVGRTLTGVSGNPGATFWEGDEVTFTAAVSPGTPPTNETFTWYRRPLFRVNEDGSKKFGDWALLQGAGTGASATATFSEPFIGELLVVLTSAGTTTSQKLEIRAMAAYPVNFRHTENFMEGRLVGLKYEWDSSSTRPADLDGVDIGEYIWMTDTGFHRGQKGQTTFFTFPDPPFGREEKDGFTIRLAAQSGWFKDTHGGGRITGKSNKSQLVYQRYWYQITDGFKYHEFADNHWKTAGDGDRYVIIGQRKILYSVMQVGANWVYHVSKSTDTGFEETTVQQTITSFPWIIGE